MPAVGRPTIQGRRVDPLRGFKFQVIIGVGERAGFAKVSGLSSEIEVAEYREGHDPVNKRKYPGLATFPNLVLERGLSLDRALQTWHELVIEISKSGNLGADGLPDPEFRRTIEVELYGKASTRPELRWKALLAWVCKLDDGELNAESSDIVVESAEICHEGLIRDPVNNSEGN